MIDGFGVSMQKFYDDIIVGYLNAFSQNPINLLILAIDIVIVLFLAATIIKFAKNSRAWQLLKGISFLVTQKTVLYI